MKSIARARLGNATNSADDIGNFDVLSLCVYLKIASDRHWEVQLLRIRAVVDDRHQISDGVSADNESSSSVIERYTTEHRSSRHIVIRS